MVDENDTWSPNPNGDWLVLFKSGTAQLIARIEETEDHDKAVTTCTIRYNNRYEDQQRKKGSRTYPLLPSEAIKLAKGEPVEGALDYDPDRCYFIKGKVNKVNSGLLSMFGDLGLDEMMGDDMDMDERMGDLDDFDMGEMGDMGGADLSTMIPGLSGSDGLTYYISDDGSKVDRLKVSNGRGLVIHESAANAVTFEKLEDLSPGDDVLVYGPIVVSEDNNLFSSLFTSTGGIGQQQGGGSSEYEWVPISLDDLCTDDVVLLVDKYETIALNSDLKGTTVTIRGDKIADGVSTNTQWTLTKNEGGTVTFKMGNNPLSVTSNLTLTVGQGQSSEFTYYDGLLGIEYPNNKRYCIKWKEADGGYSAIFENIEAAYGNTEADFTFYKRVLKEEEVEEEEETKLSLHMKYQHLKCLNLENQEKKES